MDIAKAVAQIRIIRDHFVNMRDPNAEAPTSYDLLFAKAVAIAEKMGVRQSFHMQTEYAFVGALRSSATRVATNPLSTRPINFESNFIILFWTLP